VLTPKIFTFSEFVLQSYQNHDTLNKATPFIISQEYGNKKNFKYFEKQISCRIRLISKKLIE